MMEGPRSGRGLILVALFCCLGAYFIPAVESKKQSACDRTYASDVKCGMVVLHPSSLPKHPSEAVRGEFPWHVAIMQLEQRVPVYSCGGSLVSNRFVLTAAHCVVNANNGYPLSKDSFLVKIGYHELGVVEEDCTQVLGVQTVYVHPEYRSGIQRHDLAILELERPARFNDRVLPICLDKDDEDQSGAFYRNIGKVPGWGYTEFDDVSSWLRMTEVPIVNYTRCLSNNPDGFYHSIHDGMFCGGYANGTNVCNGDSGGGLVTYRNGHWELQGIVSFTAIREDMDKVLCDTQQYAGFVKVRYYKSWIGSIISGDWEWIGDDENERGTSPKPAESLKLAPDCGKRKITTLPLIVNGVRSLAGQWPWHAAIFGVSKRSREYLCGGTLVSPSYILTSASCVTDWHPRKRPFVVQLGQNQLFESSITGREVRVLDVETSDDSSMALLRLEADVQYDDYIQPICLPTPNDTESSAETGTNVGKDGLIVGYGQTDPAGDLSPFLQATLMPIVDSGLCMVYRIFDKKEAHKMFCAGHGNGTNACKGDEGGGFYEVNQQGVWTITGVISGIKLYRKRCDPKGYVGLADVPSYIEWLMDRIGSALTEPPGTIINPVTIEVPDKRKWEQQVYHQQQQSSRYL
ncbi:hypothetical protein ZHAS_00015574 [Anopheles sinensis]|uniref:Peptidase S1 domain-containing protein n=1 Tax=Anopheles sinensis TaxID=74873 RepID=A0A084WBL0_ANOSI|nr:hypothetical protein ZHAS_00015574 [Anopheles sinensis]